jgi:hypothetical protein
MSSILDLDALIGEINTENLANDGWSYDDAHHIYSKPIYNILTYSNFSNIDSDFISNSGLPNTAFACVSIHWDYPMYRETHERLPLIHVEPKPTFRFGIRGYKLGLGYDLVEHEYVSDMGMLSMLFDKYVNKFKEEGIPERYFINC